MRGDVKNVLVPSSYGSTRTRKTTDCGAAGTLPVSLGSALQFHSWENQGPEGGGSLLRVTQLRSTPPSRAKREGAGGAPYSPSSTSCVAPHPQLGEAPVHRHWHLQSFLLSCTPVQSPPPPPPPVCTVWGVGWFIDTGAIIELSGNSSVLWL